MTVFDCSLRESLRIGREIRVHLTGRVDGMLHVFIDTAARHEFGGVGGFHARAPSGMGLCAHVLALRDSESFAIGEEIVMTLEAMRLRIPGADALWEVRLCIDAPRSLWINREAPSRAKRPQRNDC